jgi:GntR family transcriptional regulator
MEHQYQKLKLALKKNILNGKFKPGDALPSEHDLRAKYNIARFTVRQALDELVKEGLITKHKGKGSIVNERKRKPLGLFSVKGFSAVVGKQGTVKTVFLKKPYKLAWDDDFFYPLSAVEKKNGAWCYERLRSVGQDPVMLEYTYIPRGALPAIQEKDFVNGSLFDTLHSIFNIEIGKAEQELVATGASKTIAAVLGIKTGSPVLHVYRRYHTNQKQLFIYSSFYCFTGKYSVGNLFQ